LDDDEKKDSGTGDGINWLKIERPSGEYHDYELRILPPTGENEVPYYHERLHYFRVDGKLFVGAAAGNDPAAKLYWKNRDNPTIKDDPALAATLRNLKPADRYYYNVIDRSDNTVKVMALPWGAHSMIKKELINYLRDDFDITDPKTGFDIVLTVEPAIVFGRPSHKYASVSVRPKSKPIGVEGWEEKMTILEDEVVTTYFTDDEINEMIPGVLGDFYDLIMNL